MCSGLISSAGREITPSLPSAPHRCGLSSRRAASHACVFRDGLARGWAVAPFSSMARVPPERVRDQPETHPVLLRTRRQGSAAFAYDCVADAENGDKLGKRSGNAHANDRCAERLELSGRQTNPADDASAGADRGRRPPGRAGNGRERGRRGGTVGARKRRVCSHSRTRRNVVELDGSVSLSSQKVRGSIPLGSISPTAASRCSPRRKGPRRTLHDADR
jgi:hypothetical protein